jgi:hypothetical protein
MDICRNEKPPLYQMGGDHRVACFLHSNRDDALAPTAAVPAQDVGLRLPPSKGQ